MRSITSADPQGGNKAVRRYVADRFEVTNEQIDQREEQRLAAHEARRVQLHEERLASLRSTPRDE